MIFGSAPSELHRLAFRRSGRPRSIWWRSEAQCDPTTCLGHPTRIVRLAMARHQKVHLYELYPLAMTNSLIWKDPPIFKFGKPSISIRAMASMAMLVITRWYINDIHKGEPLLNIFMNISWTCGAEKLGEYLSAVSPPYLAKRIFRTLDSGCRVKKSRPGWAWFFWTLTLQDIQIPQGGTQTK